MQLAGEVPLIKSCVAQDISGMKTFICGKLDDTNKAKGYMIHRDIFDQSLVDNAVKFGTTFINNSDFMDLNPDDTAIIRDRVDGSTFHISANIIIGTDGPNSRVAAVSGFEAGKSIPGIQYTLPLTAHEKYTEVHFKKEIFGGYGRFFPKNGLVNIGLGMNRQHSNSTSLKSTLDNFVGEFVQSKRITSKITRKACGWIPISPKSSCVKGNVILAGDAAGHTHPITGAGIFAAVMCGKMAAKASFASLKRHNIGLLSHYDEDWQSLFGKTLTRASQKRELMESNWDNFEETIKKTWVAYKSYYRT